MVTNLALNIITSNHEYQDGKVLPYCQDIGLNALGQRGQKILHFHAVILDGHDLSVRSFWDQEGVLLLRQHIVFDIIDSVVGENWGLLLLHFWLDPLDQLPDVLLWFF